MLILLLQCMSHRRYWKYGRLILVCKSLFPALVTQCTISITSALKLAKESDQRHYASCDALLTKCGLRLHKYLCACLYISLQLSEKCGLHINLKLWWNIPSSNINSYQTYYGLSKSFIPHLFWICNDSRILVLAENLNGIMLYVFEFRVEFPPLPRRTVATMFWEKP